LTQAERRRGARRQHGRPDKPADPPKPPVAAFRAFWRDWLLSPTVVEWMQWACLQTTTTERGDVVPAPSSVQLLTRIMDKVHPTPQSVKMQDDGARPIRILIGQNGNEIELPYLPKHPIILPDNGTEH